MYRKFYINICQIGQSDLNCTLAFDVYKNDISQRWACEIDKKYQLYEKHRFKSWTYNPDIEKNIVKNLQKEIDVINKEFPNKIPYSISTGTSQQKLNELHKIFEILRGPIDTGTQNYNQASKEVQSAIQNLNLLIHQYEDFNASKPVDVYPDHPFASLVGTFCQRPRYKLQNEDYDYFTFQWKFGEVYINYCEVGKPILDVFKDNDSIVGKENIRPLHYYSADFMAKFGPSIPDWFYAQRKKQLQNWLEQQEFDSSDRKLSIGLIPVAILNKEESSIEHLNDSDIVKQCSKYQELNKVWVE